MRLEPLSIAALTIACACSGSQTEPAGPHQDAATTASASSEAHSEHNQAPEVAAPTTAPSAEPTGAHAPGGPHCDQLAKLCHDVGHGADDAGKCHEIGHKGDAAACEKEHARCEAVCKAAAAKGDPGASGHKH